MLLTNPPFLASITENRWANDTDGFVLTAQPGRSQGRPPNFRARSPSRKKRPAQPAFPRKPLSRSAETRSQPGQQPSERQFHGPNCESDDLRNLRRVPLVRRDSLVSRDQASASLPNRNSGGWCATRPRSRIATQSDRSPPGSEFRRQAPRQDRACSSPSQPEC